MLKSMTGYGTASVIKNQVEITAEIKTLNSKFADISVRLPQQLSAMELSVRKQLTDGLIRGKISASIEVNHTGEDNSTFFDEELLNKYYSQFKRASEKLGHTGSDLFTVALHAPGVLKTSELEIESDISDSVTQAIAEAILRTDEFRTQEGEELYFKIKSYIESIAALLDKIDPLDKERIASVEERLRQGIANNNLSVEVDQNRFEQELIYYIEKLDINEEKVRLANHLTYFLEIMDSEEANGKKMGFLAQELGREINTIGSKANSAAIQRVVVEMKEELEKIKEQSLNII